MATLQTYRNLLNQMDRSKLKRLEISFNEWEYEEKYYGDLKPWQINLLGDFPTLERVNLNLSQKLDQVLQLKPFCGLPALQCAYIENISTSGANYILETKSQWPSAMWLEFESEVSEELEQKLWEAFPPEKFDELEYNQGGLF